MKQIYICSPFRGDIKTNKRKARSYCREALSKGHLPIAPHLYFPQFLDDDIPSERRFGLDIGLSLLEDCDEIWVYGEPTEGMQSEIEHAERLGIRITWKEATV